MGKGGAERVISILSAHYISLGWQVKIATVLHSFVEYELADGVEVIDLSVKGGIKKGFLKTVKNIKRFLAEEKPDVIVPFMAQICLLVGLANRKSGVPMVCSERIDPSAVKRNAVYKKILYSIYASSKAVVLQTERAYNYFPEKIQKKSVIIPNPVRVYAKASGQDAKKIVTAGRMTAQKNQKMLIASFAEISNEFPAHSLVIYGAGPLLEELKAAAEEKGIADRVSFPGSVSDLHSRIADASVFVLPSDFEGLSNALLEAMMMGLPVIATACSGSDEAIKDGENGVLVPVGDGAALTAALRRVLGDPGFARSIAEGALASSEKYEVERVVEEWRNAIEGEER